MQKWLVLFLSVLSPLAFAGENPVVPFYRTQKSLFPSGEISKDVLQNTLLRREQKPWFRVQWNKKEFEVPGVSLLRDVHVTQTLLTNSRLSLLASPLTGSAKTTTVSAKTTLVVLRTDESWAQVLEPKQKIKGWAPLAQLSAPTEDKGVYVTLFDTHLRKSAPAAPGRASGEVLATIPRLQRLTALSLEKTFLKVRYQGKTGFVDINAVAGRADFAMWAYHKSKQWLGISHRESNVLMTVDGKKLKLDEFLAFSPYSHRGVVTLKTDEQGPSVRSRVEIVDDIAHLWNLSLVAGHGQVWWRSEANPGQKKVSVTEITSEELLKREVHSVAFASTKSMKGLASAGGIFKTLDGKTWTQVPMFEGKNYPVSIHPEGVWFVGSYRSFDEGKTFEPYIKWDRLAEKIQNSIHKTPRHLRIAEIEPLSHSRVRILVDTGVQKLKMQAHFLSQEWTMAK